MEITNPTRALWESSEVANDFSMPAECMLVHDSCIAGLELVGKKAAFTDCLPSPSGPSECNLKMIL